MTVENIKTIVRHILISEMGRKKAEKVIASIDDEPNGIFVYLSHGATLGEAIDIQEEIKNAGLDIPEQFGNAVIYVTTREEN